MHLVHAARFSDTTNVYFAALNSLVWIRVLYLFRLNRTIVPLIKIIFHMGRDIFKFLLLLILILVIFAGIGKIEFSVPEFNTFSDSIVTLYSWMLGAFNFSQMEPEGVKGMLFLAFYLLINMVLSLPGEHHRRPSSLHLPPSLQCPHLPGSPLQPPLLSSLSLHQEGFSSLKPRSLSHQLLPCLPLVSPLLLRGRCDLLSFRLDFSPFSYSQEGELNLHDLSLLFPFM